MIGLKESRQFFSQWEAKPKPTAQCSRYFSRSSSELQVISRNCDWFISLFVPVVIGRSNCFGFGFSTVILKSFYPVHNAIGFVVFIHWIALSILWTVWTTGARDPFLESPENFSGQKSHYFVKLRPAYPVKPVFSCVAKNHFVLKIQRGLGHPMFRDFWETGPSCFTSRVIC